MVGIEPFNGSYSSWIGLKNKRDIARMSLTCSVRRFGFFNSAAYGWLTWRAPELSTVSRYGGPGIVAAVPCDLGSGVLGEIGGVLVCLGSGSAGGPGFHDTIS